MMIRQAIILCGGLGTRLGDLTQAKPKPMLSVNGRPFLELLIGEVARQGFDDIVLLAGFCANEIILFVDKNPFIAQLRATVRVVVEPEPAGTGGALHFAAPYLASEFIMMNGDSLFDIPLRKLCRQLAEHSNLGGVMALREIDSPDRYGLVELAGGIVERFAERKPGLASGLINGGIYAIRRDVMLPHVGSKCSMEADVFPAMADKRMLGGLVCGGFFIDIGVPESFAEAQTAIPSLLRRPAVFFDRDGVLNKNHGYVGSVDRFEWIEGALEAVVAANEAGYLVFIVTNQAGIARGFYGEPDVISVFDHMQQTLADQGGHIDDFRYCPHHPDGSVAGYRKSCGWRKPGPGMILDLIDQWMVDASKSFLIGDYPSDVEAANAAGIDGYLYCGGRLDAMMHPLIRARQG